jgi:hypothetical protein
MFTWMKICLTDLHSRELINKDCSGLVYRAEMLKGEIITVKLWKTGKDEPVNWLWVITIAICIFFYAEAGISTYSLF